MLLPTPSSSPPFTQHSPIPRRLDLPPLPTSTSDGALLNSHVPPPPPPLPGQPKRIKPFILRSTSPSTPPSSIPRPIMAVPRQRPSASPSMPSLHSSFATTSSSAPRDFLSVPKPAPRVRKPKKPVTPKPPGPPMSVAVAEAGKERFVARRLGRPEGGPGQAPVVDKRVGRKVSLGELTNRRLVGDGFAIAPPPALGARSGRLSGSRSRSPEKLGRKKSAYGDVRQAKAPAMEVANSYSSMQEVRVSPLPSPPARLTWLSRDAQMLESSGFADTRVITPTATMRQHGSPSSDTHLDSPTRRSTAPAHERSRSLSPSLSPTKPPLLPRTIALRPSLLSLASLFGRWGSSKPPVPTATPVAAAAHDEDECGSEAAESDGTIGSGTKRSERNARAREWAERVARESDQEMSPVSRRANLGKTTLEVAVTERDEDDGEDEDHDDDKTPTRATFPALSLIAPAARAGSLDLPSSTSSSSPIHPSSFSPPPSSFANSPPLPSIPRAHTPNPPRKNAASAWTRALRHVVSDPSLGVVFSASSSKEYLSFADVEYDSDASEEARKRVPASDGGWGQVLRKWPSFAGWRDEEEEEPESPVLVNEEVVEAEAEGGRKKTTEGLDVGPKLLKKGSRVFQSGGVAAPVLSTGADQWVWPVTGTEAEGLEVLQG